MLRISGGKYRSRLLETPSTNLTKPTMDKVRAAVFSILLNEKMDNVLDLFAGSGSYGFEALSRGATKACFVDKSIEAIKTIKENAKKLNESNIKVYFKDAFSFLNESKDVFDIVFIDPPYKLKDLYSECINLLIKNNLLSENGIIVLESEGEVDFDKSIFNEVRQYKYGLAKIYILRK